MRLRSFKEVFDSQAQKRSGGGCSVYMAIFQSEAPPDRQARQIRTPYHKLEPIELGHLQGPGGLVSSA